MSGIPEDALRAARASREGAASLMDQVAAALEFTASQLQPALGQLEKALDREVDAGAFALGMMGAAFAMQGLDLIEAAHAAPVQFDEFLTRCASMQGREVCGHTSASYPSVTCGLGPGHSGQHAAGRLRW